jgi:serine O-acetyltransferase
MKCGELQRLVAADLYRYDRAAGWRGLVSTFLREPGFRLTCLLRLCRHFRSQKWSRWGVYHLCKLWFRRLSLKLGVCLDFTTDIGPGLYMPHPFGIVVNRRCRIGANCNLAQHVTLGLKSRDPRAGCPVIGNCVYIGPGAVVIGAVTIGHEAAIGANAVVTHDVPSHAVAAGVPARILSMRGSDGYVNDCQPSHPTT